MRVNGCSVDHLTVDYALNELMRPIYDAVHETMAAASLRPDLQEIQKAGLIRVSGRIYLRYYAAKRIHSGLLFMPDLR